MRDLAGFYQRLRPLQLVTDELRAVAYNFTQRAISRSDLRLAAFSEGGEPKIGAELLVR